jgi:hypothetical protein
MDETKDAVAAAGARKWQALEELNPDPLPVEE